MIPFQEAQVWDVIIPSPTGKSRNILLGISLSMFKLSSSYKGVVPFCSREGINILSLSMNRSSDQFVYPSQTQTLNPGDHELSS